MSDQIHTCASCGERRRYVGQLCATCYTRHLTAGTLGQFAFIDRGQEMSGPMPVGAEEVTYRRLDYWTRKGYLRAENPTPGSGYRRTWPRSEHRVARAMARLTAAGLTLDAAHRVARGETQLAPGVHVLLVDDETANSPKRPAVSASATG